MDVSTPETKRVYGFGRVQQSPTAGASSALASRATFHAPATFFHTVM
jgi:hypothetical protein